MGWSGLRGLYSQLLGQGVGGLYSIMGPMSGAWDAYTPYGPLGGRGTLVQPYGLLGWGVGGLVQGLQENVLQRVTVGRKCAGEYVTACDIGELWSREGVTVCRGGKQRFRRMCYRTLQPAASEQGRRYSVSGWKAEVQGGRYSVSRWEAEVQGRRYSALR